MIFSDFKAFYINLIVLFLAAIGIKFIISCQKQIEKYTQLIYNLLLT